MIYALGGSTNAVLHLLAIANEAEVPLTIDDFNRCATSATFCLLVASYHLSPCNNVVCRINHWVDCFDRIGDRTPLVGNLKPHGKYSYAGEFDTVGGLPVLMKILLDAGLIHGDALTWFVPA
eukprot:SAG31_NODE_303_length_18065_cov_5.733107_21_plen_122_part_00